MEVQVPRSRGSTARRAPSDSLAHIQPQKDYLLRLKERFTVDVFSGYRSNCETAGFEVSYQSLEMFIQLEIPFGVSVIV